MTSLELDYNFHLIDRDFFLLKTTQKKSALYQTNKIIGCHLRQFLPPPVYTTIRKAINRCFQTDIPQWLTYSVEQYDFLGLIARVSDNLVILHRIFDDPDNRQALKNKLWAAAEGHHQQRSIAHKRGFHDYKAPWED